MTEQRNIILKVSAVWLVLSLIVVGIYTFVEGRVPEYTKDSDYFIRESITYVSDNTYGYGVLYTLIDRGDVTHVMTTKGKSYISGWEINAICQTDDRETDGGDFYMALSKEIEETNDLDIRVARVTDELKLVSVTPEYRVHQGGRISGISILKDEICVTEIYNNSKNACAYKFSKADDLIQLSGITGEDSQKLADKAIEIDDERTVRADNEDIFSDAEYIGGVFNTQLSRQPRENYFEEPVDVKALFDGRKMGIIERFTVLNITVLHIAIYVVASVLIITACVFLLYGRRRGVYRIVIFEILLFVTTYGAVIFLTSVETNLKRSQFIRYEGYALGNFGSYTTRLDADSLYKSSEYAEVREDIAQLITENTDEDHYLADVLIVNSDTGEILVDNNGNERRRIDFVYGDDVLRAVKNGGNVNMKLDQDGLPSTALTQPVSGSNNYRVVGILVSANLITTLLEIDAVRTGTSVLIFVILSIIGILLLLRESRDIDLLSEALSGLAGGNYDYEKPAHVIGWDMHRMWNSVHQIENNIREVNRIQFLTYQAYFRFAPKGIERILKKESILEVESGDAIRFSGTLAMVSTDGQRGDGREEMRRRNNYLQLVEQYCAQEDGIYISGDSDLSMMRILFLDEVRHTVRFGTELLTDIATKSGTIGLSKTTVLLHFSPFVYGVAGSDDQASTFLLAKETEELVAYAEWFKNLRLNVVLTETVKEREVGIGDLRYIGFIVIRTDGEHRRIKIYEALDAEDFALRQGKKRTLGDFAEALNLFYKKDFYFARNAFSEILQEVPRDEVTKWYLFECEHHLNEMANDDFVGELHR